MSQQAKMPRAPSEVVEAAVAENRVWFMIFGILLVIFGLGAVAFPLVSTIAAKVFLGWLFLMGGLLQVFKSFSTQKWSQFFLSLLIGVIYIIAGGWLAFFPLTGILTLTIFLAVMFIMQGALECGMAFRIRPQEGWGWMLMSGFVAIIVAVLIFSELPSSAAWAIGLLVGINMIVSGWAYFFLGLASGRDN